MNRPVCASLAETMRRTSALIICGVLVLLAGSASAQGVNADAVIIGQSASLTGPAEEIGREMKVGADAYFNAVN